MPRSSRKVDGSNAGGLALFAHRGAGGELQAPGALDESGVAGIDLEDEVGAILHLIDHDHASGPFNLAAPDPVTNADFTALLARALRRLLLVRLERKLRKGALRRVMRASTCQS